jgi:hypothetical protein
MTALGSKAPLTPCQRKSHETLGTVTRFHLLTVLSYPARVIMVQKRSHSPFWQCPLSRGVDRLSRHVVIGHRQHGHSGCGPVLEAGSSRKWAIFFI